LKLKAELLLLSVGSVLPLVAFAILAVAALISHQRSTMQHEAMGRVASAMSAVDAEVHGSIMTLQALGASMSLEDGDLRSFHEEARRVLTTRPNWLNIGLASVERVQLMDANRPFGEPATFVADDDTFERAVTTRRPAVGSVRVGSAVPQPAVRVRVPVLVKGAVKYVLAAPIRPASFAELLRAQQLQPDSSIMLLDRNRNVIARVPDSTVDTALAPSFLDALGREPHGWVRRHTVDGRDVYTPYITSALSGWVLGVDIPVSAVDGSLWRTFLYATAGALAAILSALGVGWLLARRVATPITMLANATRAMGRGEDVDLPTAGRSAEVNLLHDALREASAAVRQREMLAQAEKAALERERLALQATDSAKNEFIAMLSHELRNPIGALVAAIHILKVVNTTDPAFGQARDVAERQAKQLARLIEDLLDASRIATGKVNLTPERLDLGELAFGVVETWRASGRFAAHTVTLSPQPALIYADRTRMEQVLANLLDNALKFTPAGGIVAVFVGRADSQALLRVTDSGAGIEPEALPYVFDLFMQTQQGLARRKGGLGIGLAVVKRLVTLQGGTVEAWSAGSGKGSTFTVGMPILALTEGCTETPPAATNRDAQRTRRILVIEDNDDMRTMLWVGLARSGHEVRVAADGASGLVLAAEFRPQVVLADLGLPDIDGYEVGRRLRAQFGADVLLVAVTGYGQAEDRRRTEDAGFDAHLTKPVTPELLEHAIASTRTFS
jgi:signal transduction histidine kinase